MTKKILTAAVAVALAGCGRFWENPYVDVTVTPLNWCEIHYYNASREPVRRVSVRITGIGRVDVKSGTSRLVSDSFAKTFSDATWGDIREHSYNVDPEHVRDVFQTLVNAGLFDKDKMMKSTSRPSKGRFVAVRAAFDNKTFSEPENIYETDPELAECLHNVILEFHRPEFGRRRAKPAPSAAPAP